MAAAVRVESKDRFYQFSICAIVAIVAVGVFFRFFADSPLWLDEAISASISEKGPKGIVEALRHDGHPPLYYFLLYLWSSLFGDSASALRALSGVISCFSLILCYFITRKLASKWVALLTVGVLASSPFAIRYATEARMYSLLILLILIGLILFEQTWRNPTSARLFGVSCVTACLLYTHYWSLFLVSALGMFLFVGILKGTTDVTRRCRNLIVAVGLGVATFIPWLPVFLDQLAHTGTPWSDAPRPTVIVSLALEAYGGGRGSEALLVAVMLVTLATLGFFSYRSGPEEKNIVALGRTDHHFLRRLVWLGLVTMILGVTASLILDSAFQGRYAVFFFVPTVICVGVGLSQTPRRIGLGMLIVFALVSGVSVVRELSRDRTQIGQIAASIEATGEEGDTVIFCPDQLAPAAHRVLGDEFILYAYPTLDTGERVDWYDYENRNINTKPEEIAERILSLHTHEQSIWLVWVDGYKTFGKQCSELRVLLSRGSSSSSTLIYADGEQFYNSANLMKFSK